MNLKLVIALATNNKTDNAVDAARQAGATGATVISNVRGEGLTPEKTFFGLEVTNKCDMVMFLVAAEKSRQILEAVGQTLLGEERNSGVVFEVPITDAIGLDEQMSVLLEEVEEIV